MVVFFKVKLTEENVRSYVQPEETYITECNDTKNCIACAFKMLGLYDDKIANDITQICNRAKSAKEFPFFIDYQLNTIVKDVYELYFEKKLYFETLNFIKIINILPQVDLNPNEACLFCYFFQGAEIGHAVILRKNEKNELELIDPQFNASKFQTEYSLKEEQERQFRLEKTNNYSRVTGLENIVKVLFNESQTKGYSKTFEDFNENTYIFFTFIDDLTMYVDKPEEKMEIDGGQLDIPLSPIRKDSNNFKEDQPDGAQTPTRSYSNESDVEIYLQQFPKQKTSITFELQKVDEYIQKIREQRFYNTIVSLLGTPEGDKNIITNLIEVKESEEGDEPEYIEAKTGGDAVGYDDEVNRYFFLIKQKLEQSNVGRNEDKEKGKAGYETPNPVGQCNKVIENKKPICWLCGGVAGYTQWDENVKICDKKSNRSECEHILPANLMFLMNVLYIDFNKKENYLVGTNEFLKNLQKDLYDNSCHLCNKTKDNGIYIQKNGEQDFEPHLKNILIDVITFFLVYEKHGEKKGKECDITSSPELNKIRSLVSVNNKYYTNPIRAQLDPNFKNNPPTPQSENASKAEQETDFNSLLSTVKQDYSDAYTRLLNEPQLENIYTYYYKVPGESEGRKIITDLTNKRIIEKAETLTEEFQGITRMNKNAAVEWVVRRFCEIYTRMKNICDKLNKDEYKELWKKYKSDLEQGLGPVNNIIKKLQEQENKKRKRPDGQEVSPPSIKRSKKGGQRVIEIDI
jgi:hypothetical protein